jgi:stalled ribosome rescue protein Dom34
MKDFVVWMDHQNAHVFALKTGGAEKSVVKNKTKKFLARNKHDPKIDGNAEHYYKDLAKQLMGADHILLMGPGLAKKHLQNYLNEHQAKTLAKKIIGLENFESFEHKTEKQMLAKAGKFFKSYEHLV